LGDKLSVLPMHGSGKEIGTGLGELDQEKLSKDTNGTILVDVPAIPEAHTFGDDRDEALLRAVDAIETALMGYIEDRREIPPSDAAAQRGTLVSLPALTEAKLALYQSMCGARVGKAELARWLNCHLPPVDRLLDLRHALRLDQLESAFRALGKRLSSNITGEKLRERMEASKAKTPAHVISLRVPEADLAIARRHAEQKGLPYQTYIKSLLLETLAEREKRKAK
jgi:antitoxin HicB